MLDEDLKQLWKQKWTSDDYVEERLSCIHEVIEWAGGNSIVTVVGSSKEDVDGGVCEWVGAAVAESGFHLLTGGREGVMRDVTKGFVNAPSQSAHGLRKGEAIAVLPQGKSGNNVSPKRVVVTRLPGDDALGPDSRNHVNVITAQKVVALPGGPGTAAEVKLAARWYNKPTIAFLGPSMGDRPQWREWREAIRDCGVKMTSDREELVRFIGHADGR